VPAPDRRTRRRPRAHRGVVGDPHGVVLAGVRDEAQHRAEDLLPHHAHRVVHVGEVFADYLDWRAQHPSDDIMTDLLQAEFDDETGTRRRLTREEILTYMTVVVGAGNETTNRLIGWAGKVLADHPDQRRELAADPALVPARHRGAPSLRAARNAHRAVRGAGR
jgi:cytochrome P450